MATIKMIMKDYVVEGETYCNSWAPSWSMLHCPLQPLRWHQAADDDNNVDDGDGDGHDDGDGISRGQ